METEVIWMCHYWCSLSSPHRGVKRVSPSLFFAATVPQPGRHPPPPSPSLASGGVFLPWLWFAVLMSELCPISPSTWSALLKGRKLKSTSCPAWPWHHYPAFTDRDSAVYGTSFIGLLTLSIIQVIQSRVTKTLDSGILKDENIQVVWKCILASLFTTFHQKWYQFWSYLLLMVIFTYTVCQSDIEGHKEFVCTVQCCKMLPVSELRLPKAALRQCNIISAVSSPVLTLM